MMSCALRGLGGESGERGSWSHRLELGEERVSNALDSVQKDYLLMEINDMEIYDGYNARFCGSDVIGTIVPQNSRWGLTNGYKIIENDMGKIYKIRKLTSRECLRLMGVSDDDIDKIKAANISETQQYKMAGNSIVVPVLEAIFTQMFRKDGDALF